MYSQVGLFGITEIPVSNLMGHKQKDPSCEGSFLRGFRDVAELRRSCGDGAAKRRVRSPCRKAPLRRVPEH